MAHLEKFPKLYLEGNLIMAEISLPWKRGKGLLSQNPKTLNPKPIGKLAILGMNTQLEVGSVDVGL